MSNLSDIKANQERLRNKQLERDRGQTMGASRKDLCRKERELSIQCLEFQRENPTLDCTAYFENMKNCKKFWLAVQTYRCMSLKKTRYDLPDDREAEKWRKQLPEWFKTGKVTQPDDL